MADPQALYDQYQRNNPTFQSPMVNNLLIGQGAKPPTAAAGGGSVGAAAGARAGAKVGGKGGSSSPYDPFGELFGYGMNLLGATTPGSPGYTVSQAALRAALQNAYNQSEADRSNVYGQVDREIRGRDASIAQGYDSSSQQLQANAIQRALAQRANSQQRAEDDLRAAQLFGFEGIAPTANARSNAVMEENLGAQQGIADAWTGFYGAGKQTALERNDAAGDAFTHMGLLQQQALQAMLQSALAGAQDYFVGGSGGGSVLSGGQQASLLNNLLNASLSDTRNDISTAKLRPKTTVKSNGSSSTSYYN